MAQLTLVEAINLALAQEMERDDRVMLIGQDIGINGGVFRVTEGLHERFGCTRVVDAPLAESGIIGTSIGLAMGGLRPIPEIQFEGFLGPAYDQICTHAARMRSRTRGGLTVPLTIRVPIGGGIHAPELHSDSPEAIFTHNPGMKVVMPSDAYDAKGMIIAACRDDNPVFVVLNKASLALSMEVPEGAYEVPIGEAVVRKQGTDLTIVAFGRMVHEALDAAEQLKDVGLNVEVIDARSVQPFDTATVVASIKKTHRALIVHEAVKFGGIGAEITAQIQEEAFDYLDAPIMRVAAPFSPVPFSPALEKLYIPNAAGIVAKVKETLDL